MDEILESLKRRLREDPGCGEARRALIEAVRRQGNRRHLFRELCEAGRRGDDAALAEVEEWSWLRAAGRRYPLRSPWRSEAPTAIGSRRCAVKGLTERVAWIVQAQDPFSFRDPRDLAPLWSGGAEGCLGLVGDDPLMQSTDRLILRDGRSGEELASASWAAVGVDDDQLMPMALVCHDRLIVEGSQSRRVFDLSQQSWPSLYELPGDPNFYHGLRGHLIVEEETGELQAFDARGELISRRPGGSTLLGGRACGGLLLGERLVERQFRERGEEIQSFLSILNADLSDFHRLEIGGPRALSTAPTDWLEAFRSARVWWARGDVVYLKEPRQGPSGWPELSSKLLRLDLSAISQRRFEDGAEGVDRVDLTGDHPALRWSRQLSGLESFFLAEEGIIALRVEGRFEKERFSVELLDSETGATRAVLVEPRRPPHESVPPTLYPWPGGFLLLPHRASGEIALEFFRSR